MIHKIETDVEELFVIQEQCQNHYAAVKEELPVETESRGTDP